MVVYYEAMCQAEKLVHCLQCQGHSKSLYNLNKTVSTISSKLLVRLQPNLVSYYNVISRSVLCKNWATMFKVKVATKVQNVGEFLSGWYLLNYRSFWYQTWYGDVASWASVSRGKKCLLSSRSRSQWSIKMSVFISRYRLNRWTFCYQTWYFDAAAWARVSCKKIGILFSRSWSQQGLI